MTYDIGFLGGGQLARMSIMAAQRMGLTCYSIETVENCPASQVADFAQVPRIDEKAVAHVLDRCEFVTLESEFVRAEIIEKALKKSKRDESCVVPGLRELATVQDKLFQRQAYEKAGVPSPRAKEIGSGHEAPEFPCVLKARFGGYDGKGTRYAKTRQDYEESEPIWGKGGWLAEEFIPFRRELAVMVVRTQTQALCYPTMETVQRDHVCDLVFPSGADASDVALRAVEAVGGHGLFGVELFELEDGSFQVNEIAPRPHNSGHYTLDWGGLSQFEAHVRAVLGLPIPPLSGSECAMANLLGQKGSGDWKLGLRSALQAVPRAHVHWYGKVESRPGRKMGHLNVVGADAATLAAKAREAFYEGWKEPQLSFGF